MPQRREKSSLLLSSNFYFSFIELNFIFLFFFTNVFSNKHRWSGVHPLLKSLSEDHVKGKIILDVTNPIKEQKDQSFVGELLNLGDNNSGGEEVQKALPHSHVVKVWNSVGK